MRNFVSKYGLGSRLKQVSNRQNNRTNIHFNILKHLTERVSIETLCNTDVDFAWKGKPLFKVLNKYSIFFFSFLSFFLSFLSFFLLFFRHLSHKIGVQQHNLLSCSNLLFVGNNKIIPEFTKYREHIRVKIVLIKTTYSTFHRAMQKLYSDSPLSYSHKIYFVDSGICLYEELPTQCWYLSKFKNTTRKVQCFL